MSYTGSVAGGRSHVYTYDATDNLSSIQSTPGALSTYTPNADNQVSTVTGSGQTTSWIYDPNGNLTDDGVNVYTWDAEQRLVRIKRKGDGQVSNLAYDGLGRRTSITETKKGDTAPNKTTRYIWCGSNPTPCAANGTAGLTMLEPEGEFNAATVPTQQYYARDHQGSVMQMVDNQGNTLGARQYTAYGQTYSASGTAPALGYAGMLYHAPSGLYLTPNRAYNPGSGRWLSRDPIGESGGLNLYGYAAGDPVGLTDTYGTNAVLGIEIGAEAGFAIGGPVGAGLGVVIGAIGGYLISDQIADLIYAKPPKNAYDPMGPKAPGKPGSDVGFSDPKGGENWVANPNPGKGGSPYGWQDANGDVWCPSGQGGRSHGGPHWDVQSPGGDYRNVRPVKP